MKSLKQRTLKRTKGSDEHILPLINVVFLLLIFFMIAGKLTPSDPFKITPSTSISSTKTIPDSAIIHMGKKGEITFQNVAVTQEQLKEKVEQFLKDTPKAKIRLKVDAEHPAGKVLTLMTTLRDFGVEKISLITQLDTS